MTARIDCRHSLDTIAGYRIVQTIDAGVVSDSPKVVGRVNSANGYGIAVEIARHFRQPAAEGLRSWAVVDTRYLCGCWSTERANLRASIG